MPAHERPTTVQLLDETDKFYDVLLERVGKQIAQGKSLDEIKKDPGLPEYKSRSGGKPRLDTPIEAAYRALKKQITHSGDDGSKETARSHRSIALLSITSKIIRRPSCAPHAARDLPTLLSLDLRSIDPLR